jgi:acylpyruvate hydrolase
MKLICIGRNYALHAKELKNEIPEEPVFFIKPETAILKNRQIFYYPDFSKDVHHEVELLVKINKAGKNIEEKFAHKYYDEIGIGIDFTARDIQQICKEKGLPWEKAKAFDGSAPVGNFLSKNTFENLNNINFYLEINGITVQKGNSSDMLFSFDAIIAYVSKFVTLKKGDLIFTGTPAGVGAVKPGDLLNCYLEDNKLLSVRVR